MALTTSRDQALEELKGLKLKNTQSLQELDGKLQKLLTPATVATPLSIIGKNSELNEPEIDRLNQERHERLLRQELLDRLLLQVDTKFKSGDLRGFLSERLAEMARVDLLSTASQQNLWKQMSYLSQALRDLPERGDNIIGFIEGYLQRSKFKSPLKPEEYLRARQYTNGHESVAASPATMEQVGDQLESRLNELDKSTRITPTAPLTPQN